MAPTTRSRSKAVLQTAASASPVRINDSRGTRVRSSTVSITEHPKYTKERVRDHDTLSTERSNLFKFMLKKCEDAKEPVFRKKFVEKFKTSTTSKSSVSTMLKWIDGYGKQLKDLETNKLAKMLFTFGLNVEKRIIPRLKKDASVKFKDTKRKRMLVMYHSNDQSLRLEGVHPKWQSRQKGTRVVPEVEEDEEDEEEDEEEEAKEEEKKEEKEEEKEEEKDEEKEDEEKEEDEDEEEEEIEEKEEDEDEEEEEIEEEEEDEKEEADEEKEEEKAEENDFKNLPNAADRLIERAWNKTLPHNEKFVEAFSIDIYRKDLLTLSGLNWLNDNIITSYLQLICDRSVQNPKYPKTYAFNTIFYTNIITKGYSSVRRYTRKVDLFSYEIILVPVHLGMHWCMAVIDMVAQKIEFYDSLYDDNTDVLPALKKYIAEESLDKKKVQFDFTGWKMYQMEEIPRQQNGSDCGVFSCQFGEWASRRQAPSFTQKNMPYYRERMTYEIVEQKLLAPPPLTPLRPISHEDAKDVPSCSGESTPAGALSPRSDTREVTNAYDEMIATEISYVADLKQVIIHYLEPFEAVENQNSLPEALRGKPDCLFGNIRELYKFHRRVVLEDLVAARSTAEMCRVLMQHRNKICITYRTYYQIHGSNQKVRDSVKNHPFFKDCQRKANHNLDMSSYLLKPIQRIMKYQLLLGNIMDDCPTDVRDEVAMTRDSMVELLNQIDASMQQLHISGYNGDLKSLGLLRLQTECDVYTYNRKKKAKLSRAQKRFIFFFDEAVMFCKKRVSNPGTGLNSEPEYFEHKLCIPIISLGHEATSRTGAGRFEVWDEDKADAYVIETIDPSARTKWIQRLGKSDTSQDTLLNEE